MINGKVGKPVTRFWLSAEGACGCYYCEGCECQRATSKGLAAYGEADMGGWGVGERQLKGAFPRQEQQLPTQPPAPRLLCQLPRQPLPLDLSETHNPAASRLTEDTVLQSQP